MFRGEPLALHTMLVAFFSFHLILLAGLVVAGFFPNTFSFITQIHYTLVFFGWVGALILGAQLQFFRAISGIRKYGPVWLRNLYLGSLITGLIFWIVGTSEKIFVLYILGIALFLITALIHLYWLLRQVGTKFFKFPLDYFVASHLFLVVILVPLLIQQLLSGSILLANKTVITHLLGVGWVSMSLQGAMIRVLPMFLGTSIDRPSRGKLDLHFRLSLLSSVLFSISFVLDLPTLIHIGVSTFWMLIWGWTLLILIRSIKPKFKELDNRFTMIYFGVGVFFLTIGALMGLIIPFVDTTNFLILRRLHIHYTLLFGLSILMMGALHRITSFQMYTILYTGKREGVRSIDQFFAPLRMMVALVLFTIPFIVITIGVIDADFEMWGIGGALIFIGLLVYDSIIIENVIHYVKNRKNAIPFNLKPSEVSESVE